MSGNCSGDICRLKGCRVSPTIKPLGCPPWSTEHESNHNRNHDSYTTRRGTIREGVSRSLDGRLDIQLSTPGAAGSGTNPEQLFAAGWSACFIGAIRIAAARMKVQLPPSLAIDAEVDLGTTDGIYGLAARLKVSLPGVDRSIAEQLISAAHETCPYSRATRGNLPVDIQLA